jgi:hypothetical protein
MAASRIQLNDTEVSAIAKMSEGNPCALTVLCMIVEDGAEIDPDGFMGGFGAVLSLDTHRIYGSRIWMLYKDVCGEDLRVTLAILRAVQLGFLSEVDLRSAIEGSGMDHVLDVPALVAKVEERLPNFQRASQPAA